jgi:hypothetical protein
MAKGKPIDPVKNSERFLKCGPILDDKGNPAKAKMASKEEFYGKQEDKHLYPLRRAGRKGLR